jgi:hypothetical protein
VHAQASQLYQENEALIERLVSQGQAEGKRLTVKGRYATSAATQFLTLARKYRLSYWRSPSYNLTRMLMTLLISLFYGTMYLGRGRVPTTGKFTPPLAAVTAWHFALCIDCLSIASICLLLLVLSTEKHCKAAEMQPVTTRAALQVLQ